MTKKILVNKIKYKAKKVAKINKKIIYQSIKKNK